MQKNVRKICIHQKFVVILHQNLKNEPNYKPNKTKKVMNKKYYTNSLGEITLDTATINRNFRIKVSGMFNGEYINKLVGVKGLLEILGGSLEKLVKMVLRAFNSLADKCACKIYGGAKVTFYAK